MQNKVNIPWEDRPAGCKEVVWRSSQNPIIDRYHIPTSNSIFNSAMAMVLPACSVATTVRCR